jgi:hypothetical protein
MRKPKELRKRFFDSPETRASKDFWWLVVQVEAEKAMKEQSCNTSYKDTTRMPSSGKR